MVAYERWVVYIGYVIMPRVKWLKEPDLEFNSTSCLITSFLKIYFTFNCCSLFYITDCLVNNETVPPSIRLGCYLNLVTNYFRVVSSQST